MFAGVAVGGLVRYDLTTRRTTIAADAPANKCCSTLVFAPGGILLSRGLAGGAMGWDPERLRPANIRLPRSRVTAVAVSPARDQTALATADGRVVLWDIERGRQIGGSLRAQNADTGPLINEGNEVNAVSSMSFSPDGDTLAVAEPDHGVVLWDLRSRRPAGELAEKPEQSGYVAFAPHGRTLLTLSFPNFRQRLRLWRLEDASLISNACSIAGRGLTRVQWRAFVGSEQPYDPGCGI